MKIIMNVRITQGYEKWVELFRSAGAVREQFGITVLAYGHDKDDDSSVYQVLEVESMERMHNGVVRARCGMVGLSQSQPE